MSSVSVIAQKDFTVNVGDLAYEIIGNDEEGNDIKLSDFEGNKCVLLSFSATYCGPCWETYDQMNEVQDKYKGQLKVIAVHWDDLKEQWNKIVKSKKHSI